jgi:hypothetical protein
MGARGHDIVNSADIYTHDDLAAVSDQDWPNRGQYCPKCENHIPVFASIDAPTERTIRAIADSSVQMATVRRITGCPLHWAKIWVAHPDGPHRMFGDNYAPPCPKCGKQLRTALAKQCLECGADWHSKPSPE